MTEELRAIWKKVDRISDYDIADIIEANAIDDYLEETCFIIPEEDWDEIQTRGYDIEMMRDDRDEAYADNLAWQTEIAESLNQQDWNIDLYGNVALANFWRGYPAGTFYEEIIGD